MYKLIALVLLVAIANAGVIVTPSTQGFAYASASAGEVSSPFYKIAIPIVDVTKNQYQAQDVSGQYSYGFSTGNGMEKSEERKVNGDVSGGYAYTSPEGQRVSVTYVAGANGFQASGDAVPKPVQPTYDVVEATRSHLEAKAQAAAKAQIEVQNIDAIEKQKVEENKARSVSLVSPLNFNPLPYGYTHTLPGHFVSYTSSVPNIKYVLLQPLNGEKSVIQPQPHYVYTYNF